jgi:phosphatidylethanolamine/phosphatidyl-N-methylethanolamine N-methyltransferase
MLRDHLVMAKESFNHFHFTGCVCSSSRWAAEKLAHPLRTPSKTGRKVIEIGAGTGPVTVSILKYLTEKDTLVICEMNPILMSELKRRLEDNKDYARLKNNITFFTGPIQEYPEDSKFDVAICALPFLNFDVRTVDEIFQKLLRITAENAPMTYFEYIGLKKIGKAISMPQRKKRLQEIEGYFKAEYIPRQKKRDRVWLNLLPINVYTLEMAG